MEERRVIQTSTRLLLTGGESQEALGNARTIRDEKGDVIREENVRCLHREMKELEANSRG